MQNSEFEKKMQQKMEELKQRWRMHWDCIPVTIGEQK